MYKDFRKTSKVLQDFQKFDALIQFMDSKDNSHKWPRTLEYLDNMDDWNQDHHSRSGLLDEVKKSEISQEDAELRTLNFIKEHV